MKKLFILLLFPFIVPLCAQAERICTRWITETKPNGIQHTRCEWWSDDHTPSHQNTSSGADTDCEWKVVKDRFGNEVNRCVPNVRPYTCKIWKTAILKNGSRRSYCNTWLYLDIPTDKRLICREFVSEPLSEKLVSKQKRAWLSECSKFDAEKNGKFCLLWKHDYQPDGSIISRCDKYQQDDEAGLFVSVWADYIGIDSDLKPVSSIAEFLAEDKQYPCREYTGSKMDKKQGKYTVTCTRFATHDSLPFSTSNKK